jgi:DNA-binding transcriptional MerR regulator
MVEPEIPKLYYSIGQVSKLTGLDAHVLRYWETEFRELSPRKNRGGKRLYRDSDIKLLLLIKELLYERRFTIEGARKALREEASDKETRDYLISSNGAATEIIEEIRRGLMEIRDIVNPPKAG